MNSHKKKLREQFGAKRHNLSQAQVSSWSEAICKNVLEGNFLDAVGRVGIYLAIGNEVDPRFLINQLTGQDVEVLIPTFFASKEQYFFSKFINWQELEKGPYNILQPIDTQEVNVELLDIVIIPGVVFDKGGTRLGYGKGIYDRLLWKSKAKRIGLAYDFQIVSKLPHEPHDLIMDHVVSEKRVLNFTE